MEIWKSVKGYEGLYEVSSLGRVKSLKRIIITKDLVNMPVKERILKHGLDKRGYHLVGLSKDGKASTQKIHQLVAIAFLNHKRNGHKQVVDHINENKTDNRLSNLQITTNRINCSKSKKNTQSKYAGVSWREDMNKWTAKIIHNYKQVYLGSFYCEKEAHLYYLNAIKSIENGEEIKRKLIRT